MNHFVALGVLFLSSLASAQVISPLGQELELSYTASFIPKDETQDPKESAKTHSDYLMGVLKSESLVEKLGVDFQKIEGLGAPRLPLKITNVNAKTLPDGRTEISYNYRAKAIIHKTAAKKLLKKGSFELVLPYDIAKVYNKKCTDSHYTSFGDYWYFWDPYRAGCEKLLEEPATRNVEVTVRDLDYKRLEETARFDLIRGDNGNGKLVQIDIITGFDESSKRGDVGWKIFKKLNEALESKFGFELSKKSGTPKNPLYLFEKTLDSGAQVLVRHLLVNTEIDSRSLAFAKFFKQSVEEADVIVYSGHSGLGGNLDIPSLEAKAGEYVFNPKKRQVFFFNSCSSYSYYLDTFRTEKTKARIDILTNVLAAYIDDESRDVLSLIESVLNDKNGAPEWLDVLKKIEASIPENKSYLLNVGGV
ncbi:MAG: hypothetical protein ABIR96_01020 [Bdellovibrionota bacterium]